MNTFLPLLFLFSNQVVLPQQKYPLMDVPAVSCTQQKIYPLSLNLGKARLNWVPPSAFSRLRIIFASVKLSSPGLEEINIRNNLSIKELGCLIHGDKNSDVLFISADQSNLEWQNDLVLGNFLPEGDDSLLPFEGTGELEIYGLIQTPGKPDQALDLIAPFTFSWQGQNP